MPPSFFSARATITSTPSGHGRCRVRASRGGAFIHKSISSGFVRITGILSGGRRRPACSARWSKTHIGRCQQGDTGDMRGLGDFQPDR